MLDQDVVNLAKAIRQIETGNRAVSGASGELASRYQYMPGTWKSTAAKYLGNANAPLTLENENKATYLKILDWKKSGYNPAQIASMWNSGSPRWEGKVGVNSKGVKYDVPSYVKKVYAEYDKQKKTSAKSTAPVETPAEQKSREIATKYKATFVPSPKDTPLQATAKAAGNLPTSVFNFAKGIVDFYKEGVSNIFNLVPTAQKAGEEGVNWKDVAKEVPKAAYETLIPEGIRAAGEGIVGTAVNKFAKNDKLQKAADTRLQEAQEILTADPFAQVAPLVMAGTMSKKGAGAVEKIGAKVLEPAKTVTEATGKMVKETTKYAASQATGINADVLVDVMKNPDVYKSDAMNRVSRSSVAGKVWNAIESIMNEKSETGKSYAGFREVKPGNSVSLPFSKITDILGRYGIGLDKARNLIVSQETRPLGTGGVSQLQNVIRDFLIPDSNGNVFLTGNAFLNFRSALSELSKYGADKTTTTMALAREIRSAIDAYGKKQIKGLEGADKEYTKLAGKYEAIKREYLKKDLETGEVVFKDGAITRIVNSINKGREPVIERLESIVPGISREIKILRNIEDIERAGGFKVGTYMRPVPIAGGFVLGGVLGAFMSLILSTPSIVIPMLRKFGEMTKVSNQVIENIVEKIETGKKLTGIEQEIFYDMLKFGAILMQKEELESGEK